MDTTVSFLISDFDPALLLDFITSLCEDFKQQPSNSTLKDHVKGLLALVQSGGEKLWELVNGDPNCKQLVIQAKALVK